MIKPPRCLGMTKLDKNAFKQVLPLIGLRIPQKESSDYMKLLKGYTINIPKLKRVISTDSSDPSHRLLLLDANIKSTELNELPDTLQKAIKEKGVAVERYNMEIEFDYWSADEILQAIIPEGQEIATSFETIGHIAHLNLRDEMLPYKSIIAEVLLEKNKPTIRTVVNKTGNINTVFRTFEMEVLAGDDDFFVEVKENGCRFKFDFSKTYWNSRLHHEHEMLIKEFTKDEWICDVMAGVGPFAMPAAKKGCKVLANDLNPDSFSYMQQNKKINKLDVYPELFNMDGREFMRKIFSSHNERMDHVVMNLPATAIEFLDVFRDRASFTNIPKRIHCYCFTRQPDFERDIVTRVEEATGCQIGKYKLHFVRTVAPCKDMYRISFSLETHDEPEAKRARIGA